MKKVQLRIWRQRSPKEAGKFSEHNVEYEDDMSLLEVLDILAESLIKKGEEPFVYDFDCREGICGSCGLVINGVPHGPLKGTTTCQLHMRHFGGIAQITIEPWRAAAFPIVRDLVVDRRAYDKIMAAGGYISVDTGGTPDANGLPISKTHADKAFDYAACIGCGACVAACKNSAAHLFVGAKIAQYAVLPQGQPERNRRVIAMTEKMDELGFGACSNEGECEAVCPKEIKTEVIAMMNRDYLKAMLSGV